MKFLFLLFALLAPIRCAILLPTKPSRDPFYNAPDGFEDAKVGDILQYRKTPKAITGAFFPSKVENSWQLLIRSEDSFGQPNVFVTTIIQPFNADPSKLVSYQVYEDAAKIDCAPSYAVQYGSSITTLATQAELPFIGVLLNQGYYVVVPDYEGPKLTFTVGRQSGQAVLNSVRGALKSGNFTGLDASPDVVLWGYSGGSLALGWAAALQPEYAPELEPRLLGAALGGFVTNITATAEATDGTVFAGIVANALGGLGNEYDLLKTTFADDANLLMKFRVNQFDDFCLVDSLINYAGTHFLSGITRIFRSGYGILDKPGIREVIEGNGLLYASEIPKIPMFIYHGTLDGIVPIFNSKKTYQKWCGAGIVSLEYAEDATNGHITETVTGAPAALTWIMARFNGTAPVSGCSHVQRISNFAYPGVPAAILEYFESLFKTLVGAGLGPDVQKDDISVSGLSKLSSLLAS
ncbi:Lipase 4 [Candida viswanathii]|jgi:pimeloyl-ACP methyl ester carboxylesterase|uniref:Lipase n=1 Tax=Candida viswanathii TaxID=5486 RepID=A0A367YAY5_9ASCO|nr:Lipase 4 [Candida viswanathii]